MCVAHAYMHVCNGYIYSINNIFSLDILSPFMFYEKYVLIFMK